MTFEIVGDSPGERTNKAGYSTGKSARAAAGGADTDTGAAPQAPESANSEGGAAASASSSPKEVLSALASRIKSLLEAGEGDSTYLMGLDDLDDPRSSEEIERDERIDQLLMEAMDYR